MLHQVRGKLRDVNWPAVLFVVVLSYGFLLANQSIGIDDENIDFYYKYNGMVATGRWGSWLLYKIVNTYAYLPVWRESIAILVLIAAALLFLCVYEYVSQTALDSFISTAGVCLILTYPLIARMFVYIGNCIETSLCIFLATFSYGIYIYPVKNKWIKYAGILALQILGLALIEATAVYFCVEICLFGFLNREEKKWRVLIFQPLGLLGLSVILSKLFGRLVAAHLSASGISYSDYAVGWFMKWGEIKSLNDLFSSIQLFISNLKYYVQEYFSCKLFFAACILWIAIAVFCAWKKEFTKALLALGVTVASFSLFIISANGMLPLRAYISNFIAIAGILLYGYPLLLNWRYKGAYIGKYLIWIAVLFILFQNTKESNGFFQLDYKRYLRDVDLAQNVNYDLQKTLGRRKPDKAVVFLGTPEAYGDILSENEVCLSSIFSGNDTGSSIRIHRFFSMLGYEYPTVIGKPVDTYNEYYSFLSHDAIKKAMEEAFHMPAYPNAGYILEQEDYIIVKLGQTG